MKELGIELKMEADEVIADSGKTHLCLAKEEEGR